MIVKDDLKSTQTTQPTTHTLADKHADVLHICRSVEKIRNRIEFKLLDKTRKN